MMEELINAMAILTATMLAFKNESLKYPSKAEANAKAIAGIQLALDLVMREMVNKVQCTTT